MERFFQAAACVLLAVILAITLDKQNKDLSLLVTVAAVCLVLFAVAGYLEPVIDFALELQSIAQLDSNVTGVLFKAAGISIIAQMASLICTDSGNSALGKGIHILAIAAILWLALPLMQQLLEFVQKMMGEA